MGHSGDTFKVVQVEIPDGVAAKLHSDPHLDGIRPARYADVNDLNSHAKVKWTKLIKAKTNCQSWG